MIIHGGALLVLPFTDLVLPASASVALALAWSFSRCWRTHVSLSHPAAIRQLRWGDGNHWQLTRRDGAMRHTALQTRVFIHPRLVILCFQDAWWRSSCVVLTADRLSPETFRRLRVRLLIEIKQLAAGSCS